MKTKQFILIAWLALLPLAFIETALPAGSKGADEQTIRDLESQWSAAAGAKDLEKTVSFYAADASVLPANAPIATTTAAIRDLWKGLFDSSGLAISWKTTKVEITKSGEMAYATGTYKLTMNDPTGKPMTDHGKYVTVWEKVGGSWKCGADIWNSDLPATPTASPSAAAPAERK